MKTVKIFVSSPGDVRQERQVTAKVLARLETQFSGRVGVKGYFWEHEPMHAGADFQTQIPPPAKFDVFIGILWSRLGTRLHSSHVRPDGRPYLSGSEYEFETALESYRTSATKTPRLLIYRREETPLIPAEPQEVFEERKRQWDSLQQFIQRWFTDLTDGGTFKAAFREYHNTAEFEELLEEHLRKTIIEIAGTEAQEAYGAPAPIWTEGSPYRGFKAFEFEHAAIFFGRTRAIDEVIGQLRDQVSQGKPPFVVIFGGSGSGKSSLLRAGVIPALVNGGVERFGAWRRAVFRPSQSPGDLFEGLATALTGPTAISEILAAGIEPLELATRLRENPGGLEMYLAGTLQQLARESHEAERRRLQQEAALMRGQGRAQDAEYINGLVDALQFSELRLILGLDQLEELFLEERFPATNRKRFLGAIASLVRGKTPYVWVVATLRSDFFSKCEESADLIQLMEGKGQYRLLPPNSNEFGQMIRFPARAAGLTFEDHPLKGRLDDVLRDAALADDRSLPLLELALDRLFEAASSARQMTHEAYESLGGGKGGLRGVLLNVADTVYEQLSKEAKALFAKVFKSLTSLDTALGKLPGSQEHFSRRIVRLEALKTQGTGAEEVTNRFVDARLLVAYRDDEKNDVVSVAHEALLNEWVRLRSLLEHEIDFLRLRARFATVAIEWEQDGRNPRRLARGLSLAEAREVLRVEPEALQPFEADFIRISKRKHAIRLATYFGTAALLVFIFGALALWATLSERDARRALARSDVSLAEELLGKGEAASAIAFLASAVEEDPGSTSAGDRLWFALSQRSWPLAASAPGLVQSNISAIAFSPDGSRIVAGSPSGAVKVWDTVNSRFLPAPSPVHARRVICCVFSPDGAHFITGSIGPTTRIWDARSGQPGTALLSHQDSIECAAFSADSRYVATGSRDKTVRIWDAANGQPIGTPLQHDTDVNSISFDPTTSNRLVTTFDKIARIWDRSTNQHQDLKHPGPVTSAQFTFTGDAVLTTCQDGIARLWSAETYQILRQSQLQSGSADTASISANSDRVAIAGGKEILLCKPDLTELATLNHPSDVACVAFSSDGSLLLSAGDDGKVRVWSAYSGQEIGEAIDEKNQVLGAAFTPDDHILLGTSTGILRAWIAPTVAPLASVLWHREGVQTISVSPDDKMVLTGAADSQARLWDIATCTLVGRPMPHHAPVTSTAFAENGDRFLTASADRAALWSTAVQEKLGETLNTDGDITCTLFNPDGNTFATATRNGEARFWSIPDCKPIGEVMHPSARSARIFTIAFDSVARLFLTASEDGTIVKWDYSGKTVAAPITGSQITCASFSPDCRLVATGSTDGAAVWDLQTAKIISSPAVRDGARVNACVFSPDGTLLATASDDGSARVWDTRSGTARFGALRHTLSNQAEPISTLAFSRDGKRLATGSDDGSVIVWDATNGRELSERLSHRDSVNALAFVQNGKFLVTASNDGSVRIWDLNTPTTRDDRLKVAGLARQLIPVQLTKTGLLEFSDVVTVSALAAEYSPPDGSAASHLAGWLQRDPRSRTLSPFSANSVLSYTESLISENNEDALAEAAVLASGDSKLEQKVLAAYRRLAR
ncbi:MAG TPA: WD40 repeat domain-containing protein [Chthoniobacterales bacterium]|nr:WD40 repeat domain-containing protein [Chthoniobacterales bacterium]